MKTALKANNWLIVRILVLITIAIPLGIMAYEFIILGNDSVVFLGDYPMAIGIIVSLYYSLLLVVGVLWVLKQLRSVLSLKNETKKNELLHLQSQVNPHFFFNMLNNIYGMIDRDSDKAKKLILKLSDLMRYSIYEGEKSKVKLGDEFEFLKNYIELHQMRYHKKIAIEFKSAIEKDVEIMPLLLIILIENAFKHGVENLTDNAYITIDLMANRDHISFKIENNFDESEISAEKGIGIKNLKRRLDLVYPNKHKLNFSQGNSIYKAQLELQL
ncbi:Histidine kinase [Spirosomataceae bacterium TFI 002]|nr:Histidine kinase [Spirosomataceae bacterium TFI 002]